MEKLSRIRVHDLSIETLETIYDDLKSIPRYSIDGRTKYYRNQHYQNLRDLEFIISKRIREINIKVVSEFSILFNDKWYELKDTVSPFSFEDIRRDGERILELGIQEFEDDTLPEIYIIDCLEEDLVTVLEKNEELSDLLESYKNKECGVFEWLIDNSIEWTLYFDFDEEDEEITKKIKKVIHSIKKYGIMY